MAYLTQDELIEWNKTNSGKWWFRTGDKDKANFNIKIDGSLDNMSISEVHYGRLKSIVCINTNKKHIEDIRDFLIKVIEEYEERNAKQ